MGGAAEETTHAWTRSQRKIVAIVVMLGIGALVPWLLQDQSTAGLARVPLRVTSQPGIDLQRQHRMISRHRGRIGTPDRYSIQFKYTVKNRRPHTVRSVRLVLRGRDGDGRVLFMVRSRPRTLSIGAGKHMNVFVGARNLTPDTIDRLSRMDLSTKTSEPSKPH